MSTLRAVLTALLCVLWGCAVQLPDPIVTDVEPERGWNGEETVISVIGDHFYPQVEVDARDRDVADVQADYQAWLVGPGSDTAVHALDGVGLQDYQHLLGVVPAALPPGLYGLRVRGPTGHQGFAPDVFTVSDIRAARLVVEPEDGVVFEVHTTARIRVFLVDGSGERVIMNMRVAIYVEGESGPPGVTFTPGALDQQALFPDGDGIQGVLRDGSALMELTIDNPDTVQITARSLDPDAGTADGQLTLQFDQAAACCIDLGTPSTGWQASAGVPFTVDVAVRDAFGNLSDRSHLLLVRDLCDDWIDTAVVSGVTSVDVTLTRATGAAGTACPQNAIRVGVVEGDSLTNAQSDPFQVLPGSAHRFEITVGGSHVAGDDIDAIVTAVDAWDNPTTYAGPLQLTDSVGGLGPSECNPVDDAWLCSAQATIAGTGITLTAEGDGLLGTSSPYVVVASPTPEAIGIAIAPDVRSGIPFDVQVLVRDAWGNDIDTSTLGPGGIVLTDDNAEMTCTDTGTGPAGEALFACTLFTARPSAELTASVPAHSVDVVSAPFEVHNGPIAAVAIVPAAGTVEAGQPISLGFAAFDAFGNPYVRQDDPVLLLTDDSGTLDLTSVTLGPAGTASRAASFTAAGPSVVHASQGGTELGVSPPISVVAGPTVGLGVLIDAPWAWITVPASVQVESQDTWGNRTSWSGTATLTSRETAAAPLDVGVVNGLGASQFTWSEAALGEVLDASTPDPFTGSSAPIDVVRDCGVAGPTLVQAFDGGAFARACWQEASGTASFTASFTGSVAGSAPLSGYAVAIEGGPRVGSTLPDVPFQVDTTGRFGLQTLVVQQNGCAAESSAAAWSGLEDGSPTGPITVTPTLATVDVGDPPFQVDLTNIEECSGDPASGAGVRLRTSLGRLLLATPTGAGLEVIASATGEAALALDPGAVTTEGTADLVAWVPSGTAGGRGAVLMEDDNARPEVWTQQPAGLELGLVDEVSLVFSEPLLGPTVDIGNISLTGPGASAVVGVSSTGTEVLVDIDPPADGSAGIWTLTVSDLVRDTSGNKLDGAWNGGHDPYVGRFGDVVPAVTAISCALAPGTSATFRPDGDDGTGAEADVATVQLYGTQVPSWWVFDVFDGASTLLRSDRIIPLGASDTVVWDGRDEQGKIVPNGSYRLEIVPEDALGNREAGCSLPLVVDNHAQ